MKKRRHTPDQVIRNLAEGEKLLDQGLTLAVVSRHPEVTPGGVSTELNAPDAIVLLNDVAPNTPAQQIRRNSQLPLCLQLEIAV